MNNSAISPRCDGECATMLTMPPRYGYAHGDLTAMWLRFRCASSPRRCRYVNFEQVTVKRTLWGGDHEYSYTLQLRHRRFYYASTALLPFLLRFVSFWPKFRIVAESPSSGMGVFRWTCDGMSMCPEKCEQYINGCYILCLGSIHF